ncbi:hypothetical protein FHS52_002454 [Erythromicrobium ramosum]|jgi:hypothetical protein|uniref:DUF4345 domain-containing protein n=1 Tax=Erythrobacter ramosus TaxID=35811 RepID=A0A6I4ULK3_9SPHN|nr:hypothetical protein [Erythrobacter ramosus]MBB3776485.1 hypothetical protein [Erythrobacter ramosus]MXP38437.1 hypothetical protein [Erythrobacter ramosus]
MSARTAQFLIAAVFLILGGWALFAPASVIELAFTQPYRDTSFINRFTIACFGSQAVLFGLMALVTRWSARSFAVFAVLLLPFFGFNYWFHYEVPVLTSIGMLDFAGNVTMLVLAIIGWRAARADEARA